MKNIETFFELSNYDSKNITNKGNKVIPQTALFGDTKSIKEKIKAIGGRFNPFLNNGGQKEAGWILPATKREAAMQLIN